LRGDERGVKLPERQEKAALALIVGLMCLLGFLLDRGLARYW
jgi:hypothetical protein